MADTTTTPRSPYTLDPRTLTLRDRVRRFEDDADPYARGIAATEVYRDHNDWPVVLKRAEIIARTLERLEPIVLPEERILGASYHRFKVHGGISEQDYWRRPVMHPDRRGYNPEWPMPDGIRQVLRWWQDHSIPEDASNALRQANLWLNRYGLAQPHGMMNGHTLPDHGILLRHGIDGLRARIAEHLAMPLSKEQCAQFGAMDRCLQGLTAHAHNCAEAARAKADEVADTDLASRLREAAHVSEHVAHDAPETFHQALQLIRYSNLADLIGSPGDACSFGRIDQLLYSFYQRDLSTGAVTPQDALDLICHFYCKLWCAQSSINLTVGGVDTKGNDATNPLTAMFLEAQAATELTTDLSVRLHAGTPPELLRTTLRIVRMGFGRPSLYNDKVTIPALVAKGVSLEDARDYAPLGCVEVMIPGRSANRTMCMSMNMVKVLELALNQGRCLITDEQVWDDVPDDYVTFDHLMAEVHRRIQQIVDLGVAIIREDERLEPLVFPRPWLTVLSRGGVDAGVDMTAGQPQYDPVGVTLDGVADYANALYAIERLVFRDKRITIDKLRQALRDNWQGHEPLRQYVLNRYPRHGHDDPEINDIVRDETAFYAACFENHRTQYGGRFWPMIFGVSTSLINGHSPKTGATAAGRRAGETLAMSLQPCATGPQGSTTAVLASSACVDFVDYPGGISNVQEIDPSLVRGEAGLDRLTDLVQGYLDLGGMELSLNFVDEAMLREAQADPDRHRYLMVRVFGLSAQFVNLSPEVQDTVIERVAAAGRRPGL